MGLSREEMAVYQRERRAKLAALKADPKLKVVLPAPVEKVYVETPEIYFKGCESRLLDLEHEVEALQRRVREIERQLSPEEVSRRAALKPGSRPSELYGA